MKKIKTLLLVFCIMLSTLPIIGGVVVHANEPETEAEIVIEEDKTIVDIIKDLLVPVTVGTGTSLVGILLLILPLVKKHMQLKLLDRGSKAQNRLIKEQEEQIRQLRDIDYVSLAKEEISGTLSALLKENQDSISEFKNDYADILMALKTLQESVSSISSAATVAWQAKPAAIDILSTSPTITAFKKEVQKVELLKEALMQVKGEEAGKVIAEIEQAIEEGA